RLAHHLIGQGAGPDRLVGICLHRSLELVVGLVAIVKAGAGYLPLDPAYPAERLDFMLADSAPVLLLAHQATRSAVATSSVPVLDLDSDQPAWATAPATDP